MKKGLLLAVLSLLVSSNAFADFYSDVRGIWRGNLTKVADTCGFSDRVYRAKFNVKYSNKYNTAVDEMNSNIPYLYAGNAALTKSFLAVQYTIINGVRWDLGIKYTGITKNKATAELITYITQNGRRCNINFRGQVTK